MLIYNKFIFIHLQKCAGTFIREYLMKTFPNYIRTKEEHSGLASLPKEHHDKLILGAIRNPWAWYVSWYSGRQGSQDKSFKNLFQCEFKEFLHRCFFSEYRILHDINFATVHKLAIGPYTYRYNHCYQADFDADLHIIKTEKLRPELIKVLGLSDKQIKIFDAMIPLNVSKHKYYLDYYDQEMIAWVMQMDAKIVNKYCYEPGESK